MSYRYPSVKKSTIRVNNTVEGESIETKIERITTNKEPITDGAPLVFTERKDGVLPGYNIRTDRFELAIEAMDAVSKAQVAKRDAGSGEKIASDESAQGTDGSNEGTTV